MPSQTTARVFSGDFKRTVVERLVAGERVRALANEFQIRPQILYRWWSMCERQGPEALYRASGRPRGAPTKAKRPAASMARVRRSSTRRTAKPLSPEAARIVELEQKVEEQARKIGEQALEVDFFGRALRHIEASRPRKGGRGATPASP